MSDSNNNQLKVTSVSRSFEDTNVINPYIHRNAYLPGADSIFASIKLPASEIPNLMVSKVIDGVNGGDLQLNYEYITSNGDTIKIIASPGIPAGAFNGLNEISMIFS
ncbi:MAG: hypothetical protein JSW63_04300, partial [Ignavibacterium sp.]